MLSVILFFLLISSGSVFCACCCQKKYEEILPITCCGLVLLLFFFGILGSLVLGVLAAVLLCVGLYVLSAVRCVREKNLRTFAGNLFTPAFFIFLLFNLLFYYCVKGKMITSWDEFTHWGDIVKVMVTLDDFGTNPASNSLFQSYPPAMALFQYLLQKITGFLYGLELTEWQLFFAYQIFSVALFLPFCKQFGNNLFSCLIFLVCLFFLPMLFFSDFYTSIYIDAFLGLLSGAGLLRILLEKDRSWVYSCYVCGICAMLVLAKDAGMLFAVFLAIAYAGDNWLENRKAVKRNLGHSFLALGSVLLPKLLWEWNIAQNQAYKNFSGKVDFVQLWNILLGRDTSYRAQVLPNYINHYTGKALSLSRFSLRTSHLVLLLVFSAAMLLVFWVLYRQKRITRRQALLVFSTALLQTLVYSVGLCVMFMFKFTQREGLGLASCSRYLAIAFVAVWSILVLSLLTAFQGSKKPLKILGSLALAAALFLTAPAGFLANYLQRSDIDFSIYWRGTFAPFAETIQEKTENGKKIYFLSQESDGYQFYLMRYTARPRYLANTEYDSSIGQPFYEGDRYTKVISPEEWTRELFENYDYLALYQVNDYFIENYASYFAGEITEHTIYRVDAEKQMLISCE